MPVIVPHDLPAKEILLKENIFLMNEARANAQDIRPLKIAVVNLMPTKIETETQLIRMLSNTPLQVNIDFIRTSSHKSKNTSEEHLEKFYKTFKEIKNIKYDAMIITGAPVEKLDYLEVNYWEELKEIMDYARENVYSTMFICWASQAALYHYYGVDKYALDKKIFGVFENKINKESVLTRGFDKYFYAPQSRYTYCKEEDIETIEDIDIIAKSEEAGFHIAATKDNRFIFISGHCEYDEYTLDREYKRDKEMGLDIEVPKNYYEDDDSSKDIIVRWKSHGNLLFSNWLNYCVYQETPYNIKKIEKKMVSKFGGSSLCDAKQFNKVKGIVYSEPKRNHIIVSAPGKRYESDVKVTDMLYDVYSLNFKRNSIRENIKRLIQEEINITMKSKERILDIENRFEEICTELNIKETMIEDIKKVFKEIEDSSERDFIISRGEFLNALIMASHLGYKFVDAKDIIFFDDEGNLDEYKTYKEIKTKISKEDKVVVPGFYGINNQKKIKTFERGGSDITGSIIASALDASVYENWTDVCGVMTADPKKEKSAKTIEILTYKELLEISANGAQVYHKDAIKPVEKAAIPINIKNTNDPEESGTIIKGGL